MATCSRIGESTAEYGEWLERVRPFFLQDVATLGMIDHEVARVRNDIGLSDES